MEQKTIGVIGCGYVGAAAVEMLRHHYQVLIFDLQKKKLPLGVSQLGSIAKLAGRCEAIFVCVPTPMHRDGSCDISIVEMVLAQLRAEKYRGLVILKSTVPPGTCDSLTVWDDLRIVFSPEYIGEGKYHQSYTFNTSMAATPWLVLGGPERLTKEAMELLVPILGPQKRYFQLSYKEAEMVKYMENTYFATKVTFANEFYDLCKSIGADFFKVREAWAADPRVDAMHTMVFPEKRGYDGKCLPKDTAAICVWAREHSVFSELLETVDRINRRRRPDAYEA